MDDQQPLTSKTTSTNHTNKQQSSVKDDQQPSNSKTTLSPQKSKGEEEGSILKCVNINPLAKENFKKRRLDQQPSILTISKSQENCQKNRVEDYLKSVKRTNNQR